MSSQQTGIRTLIANDCLRIESPSALDSTGSQGCNRFDFATPELRKLPTTELMRDIL
jgi:hypothetical protein